LPKGGSTLAELHRRERQEELTCSRKHIKLILFPFSILLKICF
jgi:hypothetical protein